MKRKIFFYIVWITILILAAYFKQKVPADFQYLYGFL